MSAAIQELTDKLILDGTKVEVWKPVVGFEGYYEVSSFGQVRSLPRTVTRKSAAGTTYSRKEPGRMRKLVPNKKGYLGVQLNVGKRTRSAAVHWLVLEAFVGPCPPGMECCHFPDRDPSNNHLDNLRWDTREANSNDRIAHGTRNGWKLTEETKDRMSVTRTGMRRSPESVEKGAAKLRGRRLSDEQRAKLSESHRGIIPTAETLAKRSIALKAAWARRKAALARGEK